MESYLLTPHGECDVRIPSRPLGTATHFFVRDNSTNLHVIDKSRLTAANYLGAGAWTLNPIVATIINCAGSPVFRSFSNEVWVFNGTTIYVVDANPASGTFATITKTLTITTSAMTAPCYVWPYDLFVSANFVFLNPENLASYIAYSAQSGLAYGGRQAKYSAKTNTVHTLAEQSGAMIYVPNHLNKKSQTAKINPLKFKDAFCASINAAGFSYSDDKYVYQMTGSGGNVYVWDYRLTPVAIVSLTNARHMKPGFSEQYKRLIYGNAFTNNWSFLEQATLTSGGNLNPGFLDANQGGTREICCIDDVALAIPQSTGAATTSTLHVIDVNTKAYIGYILGITFPNFNSHPYRTDLMCRNRVEI